VALLLAHVVQVELATIVAAAVLALLLASMAVLEDLAVLANITKPFS
jgi:hypothetical protein